MPWLLTAGYSDENQAVWRFQDDSILRIPLWCGPTLSEEQREKLRNAQVSVTWKKRKALPEILSNNDYPQIVSSRVRRVVEEIEPDAHDFLPVKLVNAESGETFDGEFSLLVVSQRVRAVIKERSDYDTIALSDGRTADLLETAEWSKRTLAPTPIANMHLFRDEHFVRALFCSDNLKHRLEAFEGDIHFNPCLVASAE